MLRRAALAAGLALLTAAPAHARAPHRHHHARPHPRAHGFADARPRAWCGWQLRKELGVADTSLNLAANWRFFGRPAYGPAPGVIVVWRHHVGRVVGRAPDGRFIVHSGNDGHRVRTRARSLAGAIAFRIP
jgi:hypothetical protein